MGGGGWWWRLGTRVVRWWVKCSADGEMMVVVMGKCMVVVSAVRCTAVGRW